jgi:hypothetical protein
MADRLPFRCVTVRMTRTDDPEMSPAGNVRAADEQHRRFETSPTRSVSTGQLLPGRTVSQITHQGVAAYE